jgi:peptidoglycan/LPS O-acetylase OafA/YrhL
MNKSPRIDLLSAAHTTIENPSWTARGTVPSLHGLRAVSILIVLGSHCGLPLNGRLGVRVFFVISGFLITLLLVREQERTGGVSLRDFYRRRIFRIVPAYWTFLAGAFLMASLGAFEIPPRAWAIALSWTASLFHINNHELGHTWSLSVEEAFYLGWPVAFVLLGRARGLVACIVLVALQPVIRVICYLVLRHSSVQFAVLYQFCPCCIDGIAFGCLLALLCTSKSWSGWLPRSKNFLRYLTLAAVGLLYVLVWVLPSCWPSNPPRVVSWYITFASDTVNCFLIMVIMWGCVNAKGSILYWFLNCRLATVIGVLSYSLYLWQQPFMGETNQRLVAAPWHVVVVVALATASYFLVERPFLVLKGQKEKDTPCDADSDAINPRGVTIVG